MIHVIARITAVSGRRDELVAAYRELSRTVLTEAGCLGYEPTVDAVTDLGAQTPVDPDAVTLVERWQSLEHLRAHLAAAHMHEFRTRYGHLRQRAELRVLQTV